MSLGFLLFGAWIMYYGWGVITEPTIMSVGGRRVGNIDSQSNLEEVMGGGIMIFGFMVASISWKLMAVTAASKPKGHFVDEGKAVAEQAPQEPAPEKTAAQFCTECGGPLTAESRFCGQCGQAVE